MTAPKGAKVLLGGEDLSQWKQLKRPKKGEPVDETIRWKVTPDYVEVVRGKGYLETREPVVTSGHLHVEWATPAEVKERGKGAETAACSSAVFRKCRSWTRIRTKLTRTDKRRPCINAACRC